MHSTRIQNNNANTCPQCRTPLVVVTQITHHIEQSSSSQQYDISTPRDLPTERLSEPGYLTPQSSASAFPWWPLTQAYHGMTQLPDGRLSIIVDPGAWTNLIGAKLARQLVQRALKHGHKPQQVPMERLNVQGVGNGSQACNFKLQCPIAVPHDDGNAHLHKISAPIVEGTGSDLPGLLGLRSLETDRAILDTGNRMLHFPGPGTTELVLPPGSVSIPLEKAPSGHLVIPIDQYDQVVEKKGGLKEHSLQFPTTETLDDARDLWIAPGPGCAERADGARAEGTSPRVGARGPHDA